MRCIYCLTESSTSKRRAHVAPEAILQNDVTLPLGAECDRCNPRLGRVDTALLFHNRIWGPIILLGAPGKNGPRQRLGHFQRDTEGQLTANVRQEWLTRDESGPQIISPDPPEYDELRFRRGLYHMAFNYVAMKLGVESALEARFDRVRRYVRYARRGESWPYAQVEYPDDQINQTLRLSIIPDAPGVTVLFISYLDEFYVDVLRTGELHDWARNSLPPGTGLL
jgi:hypothetical protein